MIKKENGITITALVIMIIILLILTGISATAGYSVVRDMRVGKVISNMTMVQAKAETIYDDYKFNGKELKGTKEDVLELNEKESVQIETDKGEWYKWDQSTLNSVGLDPDMIGKEAFFLVNYETGEVLYSVGTKYDGTQYHSLTALKQVSTGNQ